MAGNDEMLHYWNEVAGGKWVANQERLDRPMAPLTDVQDQTIATTLENQRIQQLPVNGRDIGVLVFRTTPGFEGAASGSSLAFAMRSTVSSCPESSRSRSIR